MALLAKLFLAALAAGLLVAAFHATPAHLAIVAVALCTAWIVASRATKQDMAHRLRLASARKDDSICTFARSFDSREVDTWVIRAVHDALQEALAHDGRPFPIRADDDLATDLRLDPEEIEMALAPVIAQRTGRSLEESAHNPCRGKVRTVADLVLFFNLQPKRKAA